jgi:glycosyltransferase involved in cell wall biosynthesis
MTLSIIVPTRNEEDIIAQTLRELHDNLTEIDHEIIVTDDASTDHTREIAAHYARIVPHIFEGRSTIGANRNNGARTAKGEYLAFIDADVFVPAPNLFFQRLIQIFEDDPNVLGVTVKIKIFKDQSSFTDTAVLEFMGFIYWFNNNLLHSGSASGEFQMVRRSAFEKLRGYDETLPVSEDSDFFLRLSKIGRTHMEWGLTAYTTNRRARQLGWPKLLWLWMMNYFSILLFKKSYTQEWPPRRNNVDKK